MIPTGGSLEYSVNILMVTGLALGAGRMRSVEVREEVERRAI